MAEEIRYFSENYRTTEDSESYKIEREHLRVDSEIKFFNDATGEQIWEPLHNKTVIAGSALTAMKLFGLERNVLDATPTYDKILELNEAASGTTYPAIHVTDFNKNIVGSVQDESQRIICGFCLGQGGAGLDISDVFTTPYCSWIEPDYLVPLRYPLQSADNVDETMYKGKKSLTLTNGQARNAYYFKSFSNTPNLVQSYVSTLGTFSDKVTASTVYTNKASADKARSYVELHLKVTKEDCREFFIAHKGIENAKINQISLVSAWTKTVHITKMNQNGNIVGKDYEYLQDIRPFSLLNIPNEILSDLEKSISIIYTLFF